MMIDLMKLRQRILALKSTLPQTANDRKEAHVIFRTLDAVLDELTRVEAERVPGE